MHLPLSWDDPATQLAIRKYMQSVRPDAPWCPSNIEFIRRINGLDSIDDVQRIVFDASYLVLGLGDVYLGAPVATPVDPRHRLVTTKYNPARTWTPENAVGIGGAYLCVYGMEGPGGYQFVGRTLQMWNTYPTRIAAVAAALLRSDPILPGERRRSCWKSARTFRTAAIRCGSKRSNSACASITRFLDSIRGESGGIQAPSAGGIRGRARALGARPARTSFEAPRGRRGADDRRTRSRRAAAGSVRR